MVSLRSGKKVPFLGKNIPKRSYSYKKPIPKETESELISKIGSISIHEPATVPEETQPQTEAVDTNDNTFGPMPSLEGTKIEESALEESRDTSGDDTNADSTVQSNAQSESEIDTTEGLSEEKDKNLGILEKFQAEMSRTDKNFKLMGLLNSTTKLMNSSNPAVLDSSNASDSSNDSTPSNLSRDMTDDSVSTSDVSTINEKSVNRRESIFSDISSLNSTLKTMIEKAIESESSSDEDECNNDAEPFNARDERRPNFSENSYQDIYWMYSYDGKF